MSPNFPDLYDNSGACEAVMLVDAVLSADAFSTESCCDRLSIGGTRFSGSDGPQDFVVGTGTQIGWSSDGSVTRSGWEICPGGSTAATTPTPNLLPMSTSISGCGSATIFAGLGSCNSGYSYQEVADEWCVNRAGLGTGASWTEITSGTHDVCWLRSSNCFILGI